MADSGLATAMVRGTWLTRYGAGFGRDGLDRWTDLDRWIMAMMGRSASGVTLMSPHRHSIQRSNKLPRLFDHNGIAVSRVLGIGVYGGFYGRICLNPYVV